MINNIGNAVRFTNECMFNTSLISVAATLGLSWAGVERKPRPFSLKYGKFQECTPVCVVQKAELTSDQKQEVLPILGSGMLFLFVSLQILTVLPQHMNVMGLVLLSGFQTPTSQSNPVLPVPKATGIPGGHQWSGFRGRPCRLLGGLLCTGSRGRRQCLINWLGVLGRVQEFAEGGDEEEGMRDELGGLKGAGRQDRHPPLLFY